MKRSFIVFVLAGLVLIWMSQMAQSKDEIKIWKDFVTILMNNEMTLERIRPRGEAQARPSWAG